MKLTVFESGMVVAFGITVLIFGGIIGMFAYDPKHYEPTKLEK